MNLRGVVAPSKPKLVGLNVKLTRPRKRLPAALEQLPGVVQVTQTFPEERDEELSTLYVLQVEALSASTVLRSLRKDPTVAFAEACAPRKALAAAARKSKD
jgi:hypothetical protein